MKADKKKCEVISCKILKNASKKGTVGAHVSNEVRDALLKRARKNKRSLSYTIGEILEAYVMPKAENKGKKGA